MMRQVLLAALLATLACVSAAAFPITVLYTNDLHVRLDRFDSLAAIISAEREAGIPVLLFDAGDTWQDHRQPIPNVWGYDETVAWMNAVSYSAMALGNHDTCWGANRLSQLISAASFPILCANWVPVEGASAMFEASTILQVGDASILVVGLITWEFLPVPAYPQLRYRDPIVSLREQLELHRGAFDLVFVVAHIPINDAHLISQQIPEIDLFITGHSHQRTEEPVREGTALIVQTGKFGRALGRLRLEVDPRTGHIEALSNDLIPTEKTPVDVRAGVRKFLTVLAVIVSATALWLL
ncbi:metallophosphoesterase [Candidatus Bipolaricaulota bacterium]|nr:metallophosphoesterase [Candidatus Bipolaricaulota bacterium]